MLWPQVIKRPWRTTLSVDFHFHLNNHHFYHLYSDIDYLLCFLCPSSKKSNSLEETEGKEKLIEYLEKEVKMGELKAHVPSTQKQSG